MLDRLLKVMQDMGLMCDLLAIHLLRGPVSQRVAPGAQADLDAQSILIALSGLGRHAGKKLLQAFRAQDIASVKQPGPAREVLGR